MSTRKKYQRRNERFYWLLSRLELNTVMLAALAETSRSHLTQVLNNKRGRGHFTRKKLAQLTWQMPHPEAGQYILTDEMLAELGWDRAGEITVKGRIKKARAIFEGRG